jgi:hypothetical protein
MLQTLSFPTLREYIATHNYMTTSVLCTQFSSCLKGDSLGLQASQPALELHLIKQVRWSTTLSTAVIIRYRCTGVAILTGKTQNSEKNLPHCHSELPRIAQSVQRLATGWTVRESNADGVEIFRAYPDRP